MLIDKTALIADVLDSNYKATLFCRPCRFGKTPNMTMMKAFFEAVPAGVADSALFEGTDIWEMGGGAYREHFASYPVICLSMRIAKGDTWEQTYGALKDVLAAEFDRHAYVLESDALIAYMGYDDPKYMVEARRWYDGYRFGTVDVYNPWSVLNYVNYGCIADVYWGNTSGNSVLADLVRDADESMLAKVYGLLSSSGTLLAPLDLGVVFPDIGVRSDALWSMLYLAGYLTTENTGLPNNTRIQRRMRIPNAEVSELYRNEVVERFARGAGGRDSLAAFHEALVSCDAVTVRAELRRILRDSASYHDITSERSVHMLILGLCFGISGFADPVSNREVGDGRPDIQLVPQATPFFEGSRPLVTIELKYMRGADEGDLKRLAQEALRQIDDRRYDAGALPERASSRVRWGIACCGKRVAVVAETVPGD